MKKQPEGCSINLELTAAIVAFLFNFGNEEIAFAIEITVNLNAGTNADLLVTTMFDLSALVNLECLSADHPSRIFRCGHLFNLTVETVDVTSRSCAHD